MKLYKRRSEYVMAVQWIPGQNEEEVMDILIEENPRVHFAAKANNGKAYITFGRKWTNRPEPWILCPYDYAVRARGVDTLYPLSKSVFETLYEIALENDND